MRKYLSLALLAGALGITASAALAGPLMLGPANAPISTPHVFSVPVSSVPIGTQVLNTYRSVRAFWVSRAIVR